MADWVVWPIFLIQGIAFILVFFPRKRFLGYSSHTYILAILFLVCVLVTLSLYHDSTDILKLYF